MLASLSPLLRTGRAALLLVVVACLSPQRAEARCGHPGAIFKTDLIAAEAGEKPSAAATESPAPAAPCPCHGPNCSGAPTRDAPPPTVAPVTPQATDATLDSVTPHPAAAHPKFARDGSASHPIDRPSSVFHPPRSV